MSYTADGEYIAHHGVGHDDNPPGRGSGRYEFGTGENPGQHEPWFKWSRTEDYQEKAQLIREYKQMGYSDDDIATGLGISKTSVKQYQSIASKARRSRDMALCKTIYDTYMAEKGTANVSQIARDLSRQLGRNINESTVRSYLKEGRVDRQKEMNNIVEALKKTVDDKHYVDVGKGTESCLNITSSKLDQALFILQQQGYHVEKLKMEQLGTGHYTNLRVLTAPETTYGDLSRNRDKIQSVTDYKVSDDGKTLFGIEYPAALDSKRVFIRYAEDGGTDKDGVIELRRGVEDLSLNGANYAQVRINVDDSHYLKGVALYSDNIPDGYDVVFNTNKTKDVPMIGPKDHSVLKPLKRDKLTGEIDKDNPFGAQIKGSDNAGESGIGDDNSDIKAGGQYHYMDKNGNYKLSPINKVSEEGDWDKWGRTLPSQFLSKQPIPLIEQQLSLALKKKKAEFEEIKSLTNPAIKQELLLEFGDSCDSDAVELRGHSLPGQRTQLLLPCPSLKPGEIYAPNFKNGERLALIRFPHSGQFEIPVLTVNNSNKEGKANIGKQALDAVGVRPETAKQLSGADYDGDTVVCLPMDRGAGKYIKVQEFEQRLRDFEPDREYPYREGMVELTERRKQQEMGKITNLIMDMTLAGAPLDDVVPAVKHSMVIIDAVKHRYDWQQSYIDNGIADLNKKYRGRVNAGAGTIITRATSPDRVPERKDYYKIDKATGAKIFEQTGGTYIDKKTGKIKPRTTELHKMETHDDAYELVSDKRYRQELKYAEFANEMKKLGNEARKEYVNTKNGDFSKSASIKFKDEVDSLNAKLQEAYKNAPRERQAQVFANAVVHEKRKAYNLFNLQDEDAKNQLKKIKAQSLANARARFGARKKDSLINITPEEWKAIEAGALRHSKVKEIIANSDKDKVRDYATPRQKRGLPKSVEAMIKSYATRDYTQAEIAESLGISISAVNDVLNK